ncbi:MAG: anti-sigma factor family protein [Gemmatimonadaceae bacterium]
MSSTNPTCGRVRRLLWPDGGPRATSPDLIDAQEHLAQCEACRLFVRDMRAQGSLLSNSALRERAPSEVRRRLFGAVARARAGLQPSSQRVVPLSWLIAATALMAVLGGTLAVDHVVRHRSIDPVAALAEDHARALGDAQIISGDPVAVAHWLAGQVHCAMIVPSLPNAKLLGARLRVLDGRRGAAVRYEVNGVAVTYFVVPTASDVPQPPSAVGPQQFERLTREGYRVVAWREPGLLHAMVGSLSESQLAAFAETCIKQARGSVAFVHDHSTTPRET